MMISLFFSLSRNRFFFLDRIHEIELKKIAIWIKKNNINCIDFNKRLFDKLIGSIEENNVQLIFLLFMKYKNRNNTKNF
jgi:hypothetical protein